MFRTGEIIDGYRIETAAGSGSYGTVYKAVNQLTEQPVALKVIPVQGAGCSRELRALKLCQQLVHPNLIRIHHAGITADGNFIFYTMDWADGGTVADRTFKASELKLLAVKLLPALETLHENGLIHRDIKPENILMIRGEPVLADIGLLTGTGSISLVGTPGFIPIDVMSGKTEPDAYSDIYAFAKTLYVLLTGKKPGDFPDYDGSCSDDASDLMYAVCEVCQNGSRVHSASAFRELLASPQKYRKKSRWKKAAVVTVVFLLLATLMSIAVFGFSRSKADSANPSGSNAAENTKLIEPERRLVDPDSKLNEQQEPHPVQPENDAIREIPESDQAPPVKLLSFPELGM